MVCMNTPHCSSHTVRYGLRCPPLLARSTGPTHGTHATQCSRTPSPVSKDKERNDHDAKSVSYVDSSAERAVCMRAGVRGAGTVAEDRS
eukprot:1240080-Prymnesium_polylepis.1